MRIIDFFDGAQSETAPTIGNIVASGIITYPDDATYEASEQGAPAIGNVYYNTTSDLLRYYNGTEWIDIVDDKSLQIIINKTIDADNNLITNISNDEIKSGAAIDVTKLHDGSVDNTEFGHLDGVTGPIQSQIDGKQNLSEKGQPNGYASLDGSGQVPASQLPSYVDDVLEFADLASFPVAGETGKLYIALGDNKTYRWTGSVYVEVGPASRATNNQLIQGGTWSTLPGANGTIDQPVGGIDFNFLSGTDRGGQGFAGFAEPLTANVVQLKTIGSPAGPLTMHIYDDNMGEPGNIIATNTNTLLVDSWPSTYASATFFFDFIAVPGAKYYFVIDPSTLTTLDGSNYIAIEGTNTDEVPGFGTWGSPDGGSTWNGPFTTNEYRYSIQFNQGINVSFTNEAYVQVEGLDNTSNTLQPGSFALPANDSIAYVTLNPDNNTPTNLAIQTTTMGAFSPGEDDLIIARKVDGGVEIARKLHLELNESAGLQDGIIPVQPSVLDNIAFIGNGTAQWDATTNNLVLDSDCYIAVSGLPFIYHTIQAQTITLGPDKVAYVTVDKEASAVTNLAVVVEDINVFTPSSSKVIISRTDTSTCWLGIHDPQRIADGESIDIQVGGGSQLVGSLPNTIETKVLSASQTSNGEITDLTFSGLENGATYEIRGKFYYSQDSGSAANDFIVDVQDGTTNITILRDFIRETTDSSSDFLTKSVTMTHTVQNGSIRFVLGSGSGASPLLGDGSKYWTYVELEKRNDLNSPIVQTSSLNVQTVLAKSSRSAAVSQTPSNATVPFNIIEHDNFSGFNPTGDVYTFPRTGFYRVKAQLVIQPGATNANQDLFLTKNGTANSIARSDELVSAVGNTTIEVDTLHYFLKDETVQVISNNSQSASSLADATRNFFEIQSVPDFTVYGAVSEQESAEAIDNSSIILSSPTHATWYTPQSAWSLTLDPGEWDIDVQLMYQAQTSTGTMWSQVALTTSTTPGVGIVTEAGGPSFGSGDAATLAGVNFRAGGVVITSQTTFYVQIRANQLSAGATLSSLNLRNELTSGPGLGKIFARRIK